LTMGRGGGGGGCRQMFRSEGVDMHEAQIYIKNTNKQKSSQ